LSKDKMEVLTRRAQNALVIDLKGAVDLFSSPKMRSAILEAINTGDVPRVAINLSEVGYIDSSGIASLVEGLQLARTKKCRLILFGLQHGAREVLELSRLDKVFDIRSTELDALAD
jgi:anti-sigma B factor antagonist